MDKEKNENIYSQNDEEETFEDEDYEESLEVEEEDSEDKDKSEESDSSELEELKKKYEELEGKNKQLFERLKKTNKKPAETKNKGSFSEEDLIRISKVASSLDDDDLEVLQSIKGESIADKLDNPMFKAYKKDKQAKQRSEASSLKPSKPGLQVQGKSFDDPNLSAEDHKKMFNKLMS